jgi:LacI family transcriptional regulator
MATIKDVAKLAGVSPATVSRVLTSSTNTSLEVREKVKKAMEDLNYQPNLKPKALLNNNKTICLTVVKSSNRMFRSNFYSDLIWGASSQTEKFGANLQLSVSEDPSKQYEKCISLYKEKRVSGFILSRVASTDKEEIIQAFQENEVPFVLIGNSMNHNVFSVHNDNIKSAYLTTKHLVEQGYKKIIILNGKLNLGVIRDRVIGFQQAMNDFNLPVTNESIIYTDIDENSLHQTLSTTTKNGNGFDAIITSDSLMSFNVLNYCKSNGLSVPNDVGIIGFNDDVFQERTSPSISGVRISSQDIGKEAVNLLMELLDEPNKIQMKKNIILPSEIIPRKSTNRM